MKQEEQRILDATTKQAIVLIGWYLWCIVRNIAEAINKAVHKFPWVCMAVVIAIAFIVSFIFISKARTERDSYNSKYVHTQMQLDSYKACYGNGEEM